jgi:hypothetical protein
MGNKSNPELAPGAQRGNIIERPDGFYWEDRSDGRLYGPFPSLLEAEQDMLYEADSDFEEGETLEEAEAEIGISDWVDPDTGALAEDASPRLNDD